MRLILKYCRAQEKKSQPPNSEPWEGPASREQGWMDRVTSPFQPISYLPHFRERILPQL